MSTISVKYDSSHNYQLISTVYIEWQKIFQKALHGKHMEGQQRGGKKKNKIEMSKERSNWWAGDTVIILKTKSKTQH